MGGNLLDRSGMLGLLSQRVSRNTLRMCQGQLFPLGWHSLVACAAPAGQELLRTMTGSEKGLLVPLQPAE